MERLAEKHHTGRNNDGTSKNYIIMAIQFNSDGTFNELVFENKNKTYGAYAIRKSYSDTVTKSLLITLGAVCVLFLSLLYFTDSGNKVPEIQGNIPPEIFDMGEEIFIQPKVKIEKKEEPTKNTEPAKSETGDIVASDDKKDLLDKTNDQMHIAPINNDKGADSAHHDPEIPNTTTIPPVDTKYTSFAELMPELKNMNQFIADNLRYPAMAVENGTSGTVFLSFIVEKDGAVSDVKVLRAIGDGCEEEAMRVVKAMPKWTPGKNHGEPVRVLFNIPIRFRLK